MKRIIITTTEHDKAILLDIPDKNVWTSEPELVELFGVIAPTLRVTVGAAYKSGVLKKYEVQKYVCLKNSCYTDVFGFPMIMTPAFRINSLGAGQVHKAIFERLYL